MHGKKDARWLALGALAGLVAAAFGILRQSPAAGTLPDHAVASVNGVEIARDRYERAAERLLGPDSSEDEGRRLLQSLIEEELLVQRGAELGITKSDPAVRDAIVNSLVASITAEADAANPADAELQEYLEANAERFSYTAGLSVRAWETDVEALAQVLATALREDQPLPPDEDISPLPDLPAALMSLDVLRDYLGAPITAAAADMPEGSSAVFARRGRWLVVQVVKKQRENPTELANMRNRVLLDYRRNLADSMLRDYLGNLGDRADIVLRSQ